MEECVLGLAAAAASKRWPQPLVVRNGELRLTQKFVEFHREKASTGRLVLIVRVDEGELFFAKREHVKLKPYNEMTHLACLMEHNGIVQVYVVPFSQLPERHKLPADYCAQLRECEMPCEECVYETVESVCSLETFYDTLHEMRTVGLSEKEILDMLHPYIMSGAITWSSDAPFCVRSVEDTLRVRQDAQRMIDRVTFCSGWTPDLLRELNIKRF